MTLREKLVNVYEKIDHIEKAGDNQRQGYSYVRAADVLHAIRKAFSELGIYAQTNYELLGTYDIKTNKGGVMHAATVKVSIVLYDADSTETIAVSGLGDGADSGDKGIYKAQTGATKNALRNAFLIPDEADPEADERVDERVDEQVGAESNYDNQARKPTNTKLQYDETADRLGPDMAEDAGVEPFIGNESFPANDGKLPNEKELANYGEQMRTLANKLAAEGGLKAKRGLPINRQVLGYLSTCTGTEDYKQISVVQFDTFFRMAEKLTPVQLAQLVTKNANGGN